MKLVGGVSGINGATPSSSIGTSSTIRTPQKIQGLPYADFYSNFCTPLFGLNPVLDSLSQSLSINIITTLAAQTAGRPGKT